MSRLKVAAHGEDTGDRIFRELKAKRTFIFANRLYVKTKEDPFYGKCVSNDAETASVERREMNCFCFTSCSFGSFRPNTVVKTVAVEPITIKTNKKV